MSICILHKDGWGVCDSRETIDRLILPSVATKITKTAGYLVASVGDGILSQLIRDVIEDHGNDIELLKVISTKMSNNDYEGEIISVSYKGELIHIDDLGCMSNLNTNFWAIGSSSPFVLGRLFYIEESHPVTIEDAEAAIKAAAKFDSGIDDRVQKFYLDRIV